MNDSNNWYRQLKKPSWAPKEEIFGYVWTPLYIIIFIVNIFVISKYINGNISLYVVFPFWLNIFFNLIFTPIQFGLKNNFLASVDILSILITIIWSMIIIWPLYKIVSIAFVPYLIWVSIATVLQLTITALNK